ncbi:hypothetical protein XFLM_02150 [Xylella fastidiosa subsp. fastidiosa GB514]|nr:hypothetical protein XFLM_02150 [Xylella fastidiosa subsp. fastidiosa GB514]KAF0571972.1 hypothetical protein P305_02145 [Xylella fastidiosa subsp. fastidiosa Mus-1]
MLGVLSGGCAVCIELFPIVLQRWSLVLRGAGE